MAGSHSLWASSNYSYFLQALRELSFVFSVIAASLHLDEDINSGGTSKNGASILWPLCQKQVCKTARKRNECQHLHCYCILQETKLYFIKLSLQGMKMYSWSWEDWEHVTFALCQESWKAWSSATKWNSSISMLSLVQKFCIEQGGLYNESWVSGRILARKPVHWEQERGKSSEKWTPASAPQAHCDAETNGTSCCQ